MKQLLVISIFLFPQITLGQNFFSNVPGNTANSRYYSDIFCDARPCLTLNGFQGNYGSVDKFLERLYSGDLQARAYIDTMATYAFRSVVDVIDVVEADFEESELNQNTMILQSISLVTLLQYVSEKNGRNLNELNLSTQIPSSNESIALLKLRLTRSISDYLQFYRPLHDHVKYTRSYMSFARALDLYLALENAFGYYNEPDIYSPTSRLLSKHQKNNLLVGAHNRAWSLTVAYGYTPPLSTGEPGNRPLKIVMAAGYMAMTQQDVSQADSDPTLEFITDQLIQAGASVGTAINRAGPSDSPTRQTKWAFQTDGGKRLWAEGAYYLEYALLDALPFWHAVRQADLLNTNDHGLNTNIPDPFHSDWFLNPVEWLADISTPDGMTPPLDDGNKRSIRTASILNWDSSYGRQNIGRKYAWVLQNRALYSNTNVNADRSLYLLELAIPKTQTVLVPPNIIGPGLTGTEEQQTVFRYKDVHGNSHWLLVNGEFGNAITNGEGHEQPDQLQMLYYVNDHTMVRDAGYDKGSITGNSEWNGFFHHNGISLNHEKITDSFGNRIYENKGGLLGPKVDTNRGHKYVYHNQVTDLQINAIDSLIHI